MSVDDPPGYDLLERTVELHDALDDAQLAAIARLVGRELGRGARAPGYLLDLTGSAEPEVVLGYLRAERVEHTLAEERRWRRR